MLVFFVLVFFFWGGGGGVGELENLGESLAEQCQGTKPGLHCTLVGGECCHHYAIPFHLEGIFLCLFYRIIDFCSC